MFRRFAAAVGALALVGAACSTTTDTGGSTTGGSSGSGSVTVHVDWDDASLNTAFFAYFPRQVKVHAGDTVAFKLNHTGEPHTVTFGTKLNEAVEIASQFGPDEEPPPAVGKKIDKLMAGFPNLLPDGPGDANQAAANPCFLATGAPPEDEACAEEDQVQPEFDGTASFYNSGWMDPESTFTMEVSADTAPGTYSYFCLLHTFGMTGEIEVVAADAEAHSADDVQAAAETEANEAVTKLQAAADALDLEEGQVAGGVMTPEVGNGMIAEFLPAETSVAVGGTVTWVIGGPHTISFNAPEDAVEAIVRGPDGLPHVNEKALAPQGFEAAPPSEDGPPGPTDMGTWDGQSFISSGLLFGFGPGVTATMTFATAGTYEYVCLIHPDMEGTITVA